MTHKNYDGKLPDPVQAAKDTAEYGVISITNSNASPEEFAEWSLSYGYHLSPDIWCTDSEHSDLFWRVTNEKVDDENQGLFADYELDWHTNITPVVDAEECVGLYAKIITYHTETWFCNSIPYWNELSKDQQSFYEKLDVVIDPMRRLGLIKNAWQPNFKEIYGERVMEDISKNRKTRTIGNCKNIDPKDAELYSPSRGMIETVKFVPNHPLGTKGFFFTPYEVHGFSIDGEMLPQQDSKDIWNELWEKWISTDKYTYKHAWKVGDICLMDQLITIHRRPTVLKDKPRELLRTASWYKTDLRKHHNHVL